MRRLFVAVLLVCLVPAPAVAGTWLVVSDVHLNPYDAGSAPSPYGQDTNWALWSSALRAMRAADPHPGVVVVAGDLLAHRFPSLAAAHHETAEAAGLATMRRIAGSIAATFPHVPIVVALGNNDDPCGDYRAQPSGPYLQALASIWHRPLQNSGSYVAPLPGRDRAVVLDDVFWSAFFRSCAPARGDAGAAELAWLRRTLSATPAGTADVLVEHIPPGVDAVSTLYAHRFLVVPYLRAADESAFLATLRAHARRIAFAIAGHAHRSDVRLLAGVPTIVVPSISPIYGNDPAFVRLDVDARGLRDYAVIAFDPARSAWALEFDFDRVYGTQRVDAAALAAAHDEIAANPAVRARWASALVAGSPHAEVNAVNWRTAWCAQTSSGRDFADCAGLRHRLLVIPIVAALLAIVVIASVVLILLRVGRPAR